MGRSDGRSVVVTGGSRGIGASALVNNAGIVDFGTVEEQEPKAFQHVLDVNLFGPWLGMHVLAPYGVRGCSIHPGPIRTPMTAGGR